jgi:hypothetical protein
MMVAKRNLSSPLAPRKINFLPSKTAPGACASFQRACEPLTDPLGSCYIIADQHETTAFQGEACGCRRPLDEHASKKPGSTMKKIRPVQSRTNFILYLFLALLALFQLPVAADDLQLLWQLSPGDVSFLTTGNTERGIAYNPATGHLLVVARNEGTIHILDASNGVDLGVLNNGDGFSGGTYAINMIGVTDDGVIYVGNLSTSTTFPEFKLYRWESETAEAPTVAFDADPSGIDENTGGSNNPQRWGDSLDVRGSSTNAQIIAAARNGTVAALITSTNGIDHAVTLISNASSAGAISVAFGSGNTFFTKLSSSPVTEVSFDPVSGLGTVLHSLVIPNSVVPIGVNASSNWLAGIQINRSPAETPDNLILYNISDRSKDPAIVAQKAFPGTADNANFVGAVDTYHDLIFALDTNNGLVAYRVIPTVNPPTFASPPVDLSILEGGFARLDIAVIGTPPFTYQWLRGGTNITDATNDFFAFTNVTSADAGEYSVLVSNTAGSTNSAPAVVTILPSVRTSRASLLWSLAPGSRPYLTTGNTERGLAYNPVSNHLLVITRTGEVEIHVLDGDTGAELWTMNAPSDIVSGSNPGGFRLNLIAVAGDGVVYAANLTTGATGSSPFTIYRWDDDSTNSIPTVAYSGAPTGERYGDSLTVRGSGVDTQLLAATRNGTAVVIFTTFDGYYFDPYVVDTPDASAGNFGLGVAFGEGDTFWGKATGDAAILRQVQFDLGSGSGIIARSFTNFPTFVAGVAVNTSSNLLAGIALETPDSLRLYDISDPSAGPVLIDQDFFPTDHPNVNGSGSVSFGNDRLYALDSNNGILALKLNAGSTQPASASFSALAVAGNNFSFTVSGTPNSNYDLQYTTDFVDWNTLRTITTGADGSAVVTDSILGEGHRFYRAVAP